MTTPQANPQPGARSDAGNQAEGWLKLGAVQVVDIVSSVVHELDRDGKRVQIVMERAPTVMADSDKLAQATRSLLLNALSTSSEGPIEVEVAARCLAQDHEYFDGTTPDDEAPSCEASVSVAIRDRGGPSAQKTLSLSDARRIVQLHNGRLWYTAGPENGRTFGLCLGSQRAA